MQWRDTGLGFGIVTIILHWIGAGALITFYVLDAARLGGWTAAETCWPVVALAAAGISAFRLFWRYLWHHPLPLPGVAPLSVLLARAVAIALLLSGVILPLLGWAEFYRGPEGVAGGTLRLLHRLGLLAAILGLALHVAGGLRQQFMLRNRALSRLLGARVEL